MKVKIICPKCKEMVEFEDYGKKSITYTCKGKCKTKYRVRFDADGKAILRMSETLSDGGKDVEVKGLSKKQKHAILRAKSISEKRWLSVKKDKKEK